MKYDLIFDPPVMNAAGTLGYAPDLRAPLNLKSLGAFITNPVSPGPRSPAQTTRYSAYAGGFLLHTGHPNPGLKAVLRKYAAQWARSPLPILVHLLCQRIEDGVKMAQRLEGLPGVAGFELGLPSQADTASACALVQAIQGELPLIVRLPLERAIELGPQIATCVPGALFSLGPPRGARLKADKSFFQGRCYGPALFPQALSVLQALVAANLQVIAGCGVYTQQQAQEMLALGASGVQLDSVLWRGGI